METKVKKCQNVSQDLDLEEDDDAQSKKDKA